MDHIKELKNLLENDILIEVNENIKEIEETLSKKKNKVKEDELEYMMQVKLYFDEALRDIENDLMTQEQALDIIEGLEDMKVENQEI